jgi:hypothetical protein
LTPDQIRRTNAAKKAGTVRGQQWVKQPADVAEITSRFSAQFDAQYPWMPYEEAHSYEREAEEKGVSKIARAENGFMRMYEKHGAKLRDVRVGSITWRAKRHNFISRHMAQYRKHPTYRRWLAFRMWAFDAGEAPKA